MRNAVQLPLQDFHELGLEVDHEGVLTALGVFVDMVMDRADAAYPAGGGLGDRDLPRALLARQMERNVAVLGRKILVNVQHLHGGIIGNREGPSKVIRVREAI